MILVMSIMIILIILIMIIMIVVVVIIMMIIIIMIVTVILRATKYGSPTHEGNKSRGEKRNRPKPIRPVRLLRVWISEGLTQAYS